MPIGETDRHPTGVLGVMTVLEPLLRQICAMPAEDPPLDLGDLYDRFGSDLHAYALVLVRDPARAQDIVQECFVRLSRNLDRLSEVEDLAGYVFRTLRNEAYSQNSRWARWWRDQRRAGEFRLLERKSRDSREEILGQNELNRALGELPTDQREVVFLKVWERMTFPAIGELLGISSNTAASRYRYALLKLRRKLDHVRR